MNPKETTQKWLIQSLNDPIVKILAKNSNLTKTQLETLLIDILAENFAEKILTCEEKAKLRLTRPKLTRGAYNRTLRQAQKNVIQSLYTIFLLGYLGVFNSTKLDSYIETANKLQRYVTAYKDIQTQQGDKNEYLKVINMLRQELETTLEQLSKPKTSVSL
ncbi:MAG: hypothetical protein QXN63_01485 [Candidatus Bathyarchaeia archaeon]